MRFDNYRMFIFDLDNTLLSSESQHATAFDIAIRELAGYELTAQDRHEYIGNTSGWMAEKIITKMGYTHITPADVSRRKTECVMQIFEAKPYPGACEFVHKYHGKKILTVASNSPRVFVHHALKAIGLFDLQEKIKTIEDVKNRKPDPEMFLALSAEFGIPPSECLVFEDTILGLQAAISGGFPVVLLVNPGNIMPDVIPDGIPTMTWPQLLAVDQESTRCGTCSCQPS